MFHPNAQPMERGWVGRVDGGRVVHLAAQTLQAFFLGGGRAREHAEYPLDEVTLLVPVLHPPVLRVFDGDAFEFANPTAVRGPGAVVAAPDGADVEVRARLAAVIGADAAIGGFSAYTELRAPALAPPKDRDFGSVLGPVVVTPDELDASTAEALVLVDGDERLRGRLDGFDWEAASALATAGTTLRPGDLLVSPPMGAADSVRPGVRVGLEVSGIGLLAFEVAG